jgi:hypothetical protein
MTETIHTRHLHPWLPGLGTCRAQGLGQYLRDWVEVSVSQRHARASNGHHVGNGRSPSLFLFLFLFSK